MGKESKMERHSLYYLSGFGIIYRYGFLDNFPVFFDNKVICTQRDSGGLEQARIQRENVARWHAHLRFSSFVHLSQLPVLSV